MAVYRHFMVKWFLSLKRGNSDFKTLKSFTRLNITLIKFKKISNICDRNFFCNQ